ncbi:PAS domain-containing protein [Nostoc sp. PCC 7107]|uniref:PAS domain-containing protein n=1 Tax=Nostoc sp. PCC 7107 TaxID=317936 RepID=UPI00029F35C8|nr:PAS domain-containing protein [Nostoc sp. PCC 7107]AFY44885.1 multi-sensor signal transduction histidine kinase [Nostoc sp. PCC 7107]
MVQSLTVLIIDDSPEDREVYRRYLLQDQEYSYTILESESGEEALELYRQFQTDCILLDFLLPDMDGLEFLAELPKLAKKVIPAVVMLTGYGNEAIAVQAMKSGVHDYLVKGQTTAGRLHSTIHSAIAQVKLRQELQQSEARLRESQQFIERIAETTPGILYVYDLLERRNLYLNSQVNKLLGYSSQQIQDLGQEFLIKLMYPEDLPLFFLHLQKIATVKDSEILEFEYRMRHADGRWHWFYSRDTVFIRNDDGSPRQIVGTAYDITNRKQTEAQLSLSNERFQLAAAAVNCLIYDWNIPENTVERTEGLTRILGYSAQEAEPTQEWWMEKIHPEDRKLLQSSFEKMSVNDDYYALEYRVRHKNNQYRYVLDQGVITRDQNGQLLRAVGSTTDISDRKYQEAALRESEAKFRRIVESNIVGIYFGDFSGRIYEANDAFLEMLGYTRAELKTENLRWDTLTPAEYQSLDQQKVQELQTAGVCTPFEKEYFRKDGTRMPILLGIARIDGTDKPGYCVCFVLDLTQRKLVEIQRQQLLQLEQTARAEAEAANHAKDEFVAMVSHDLRSPLNAILGWAQLLRTKEFDKERVNRALETIERNALSQAKLLEDLLNMSQILRGKLHLELKPVDLGAIVREAIQTAYPAANAKNIHLECVIDQPIPAITGDGDRLLQVLGNLLSNAIKFTPDGGQINVKLFPHEYHAEITVTDTGIGISPEFLPFVFERYRQDYRIPKQGGLGLGLAIAHYLIELHGGTIQALSLGEGQGSTFSIKLPWQ